MPNCSDGLICRDRSDGDIAFSDPGRESDRVLEFCMLRYSEFESLDSEAAALSWEEQRRRASYYHEQDAQRFSVRRQMLRRFLSDDLNCEPSQVKFAYERNGKPYLCKPTESESTASLGRENRHSLPGFSLASSGDYALFAKMRNARVGVDLEQHIAITDLEDLANTVLHQNELIRWQQVSNRSRLRWFYDVWTLKEAVLKCIGTGLGIEPNQVDTMGANVDASIATHLVHRTTQVLKDRDYRQRRARVFHYENILDRRARKAIFTESFSHLDGFSFAYAWQPCDG